MSIHSLLIESASVIAFLLTVAAVATSEDSPKVPSEPVACTVLKVHDADTITADINLPFSVTLPSRSLRAYGYDAWEVSHVRQTVYITAAEILKGLKARDEFNELLKTGTFYIEDMTHIQPDPYGRLHAKFWVRQMSQSHGEATVKWVYVPRWMEEHGHCRPVVEK